MSKIAGEFLSRCFAPDEIIALLLRRESPPSITQRLIQLERVLKPRYLAWLSHENSLGSNIHFGANPLLSGSRKRTKEKVGSVRHLYIDIDTDGDARLTALRVSGCVPTPTAIVSTSPGKYQVLWRVTGFDFADQEVMLKLLAGTFGGDPACTDCNRVLRIPGFLNWKYRPAPRVTVTYLGDSIWSRDDFRPGGALSTPAARNRETPRGLTTGQSHSEIDWEWVSNQLAHGRDALKLTRELASRRSDKPDPLYYARRTVDIASARLWLLEGISTDDVVTMLASRRRFEIPAVLCSARAREIAATAVRMVARTKSS